MTKGTEFLDKLAHDIREQLRNLNDTDLKTLQSSAKHHARQGATCWFGRSWAASAMIPFVNEEIRERKAVAYREAQEAVSA